jgi:hypothetical protein
MHVCTVARASSEEKPLTSKSLIQIILGKPEVEKKIYSWV